jgi:hypothetical protein
MLLMLGMDDGFSLPLPVVMICAWQNGDLQFENDLWAQKPTIKWAPRAVSAVVRGPWRESYHWPSTTDDKNVWSYTSIYMACTRTPLCPLTPWSIVVPEKLTGHRILWNQKVHHRIHKRPPPVPIMGQSNPIHASQFQLLVLYRRISPSPRPCEMSRNTVNFCGEEVLAPRLTPKLEDDSMTTLRDCLFNKFVATLNIRPCHGSGG